MPLRRSFLLAAAPVAALLITPGCSWLNGSIGGSGQTQTVVIGGQSNAVGLTQYGLAGLSAGAPGLTFNVIPCAVGATSAAAWLPGEPLFKACIEKIAGRHVDMIFWLQGESEAESLPPAGHDWDQLFANTVYGFRQTLRAPVLPVYFAKLSDGCQYGPAWPVVRAAQDRVAFIGVFPVSLDGLKCDPTNFPHYTPAGYEEVGKRFGRSI